MNKEINEINIWSFEKIGDEIDEKKDKDMNDGIDKKIDKELNKKISECKRR